MSWLIHSGVSGTLNWNLVAIQNTFTEALLNIEDVFHEATLIAIDVIVKEDNKSIAIHQMNELIDNVHRKHSLDAFKNTVS